MMKAQMLYNLLKELEFCSGTDLHEFFRDTLGDPSPSGNVIIDDDTAYKFICRCAEAVAWNSDGDWTYWSRCENAASMSIVPSLEAVNEMTDSAKNLAAREFETVAQ